MSFTSLGDSSVDDYRAIYKEGEKIILACYNMSHCGSITDARKELWRRKISKCLLDHPPLCTLPPTEEAFNENCGRTHLQLAIWNSCTEPDPPELDYLKNGWKKVDGSSKLKPVLPPKGAILAPPELLRLIKWMCKSETRACASGKCTCKDAQAACTEFCVCKGENGCHNEHIHK